MEPNLAELAEAVAAAIPDRECLVWRERRLTWSELRDRTRRLASFLGTRGLRLHRERRDLAGWESGQDHVALCLYNSPEYLESMLGCFAARAVPINVNYKYTAAELIPLLRDADARVLVYHASFAPVVDEVRSALPRLSTLLQVRDASGNRLLPGALDYEMALAASFPKPPELGTGDDLYVLYTGGTTGRPKGVLWRQADIYFAALGGRRPDGRETASIDEVVERARKGGLKYMPTAPFMHAAHWVAFDALFGGHTVVLQDETRKLDPASVLDTCEREGVHVILIVGDAFARPLLDEIGRKRRDLSSLKVIGSGGAVLGADTKSALLAALPEGVKIIDTVGSSETGTQASHASARGREAGSGSFRANPGACVLSADRSRRLAPGDDEIGWFAQSGRVPLGYLGDPEKTAQTFQVVEGVRYSIPGDRARLREDGSIEVLGRDSMTINSGGEKIFVEEVEQALKRHPSVQDAVVCGVTSERWGSEVAAVVQLRAGAGATEESLVEECRRHLARYKVPKRFAFRDAIERSPSGKPDYAWARTQFEGAPDLEKDPSRERNAALAKDDSRR
jgi:3-oxocholest-4-en-26-oate---CoA ligase